MPLLKAWVSSFPSSKAKNNLLSLFGQSADKITLSNSSPLHFYFCIQFSLLGDFKEISKEMNFTCSTSKFQNIFFLSWLPS